MELNGVNSSYTDYGTSAAGTSTARTDNKTEESKANSSSNSEVAATYEKSSSDKVKNKSAIIAQLKADSENRMAQLQSLVTKMFEKQGITIGNADDMWKHLASGNFTADADTIAQAKEDISEDGYWGVKQTSDRIFDFAMALAGDDEKMMEKMKSAVEKGFKQATHAWGKELPSISNDTYDAVMKKFDDWFAGKKTTETETEA